MSLQSQLNRVRAIRRKLFPPPRQAVWMPQGVYITEGEEEGLCYLTEESEATYERCEKLGITPNVYIVSDEWHPDMDGIDR